MDEQARIASGATTGRRGSRIGQFENANKQQAIATGQHVEADNLSAKADKLDALGHALEADAVEIKGDMQVVQRRATAGESLFPL